MEQFLSNEKPDVVVYDVAMPYASNWDLLDVIRQLPSVGGKTRTLPIGGGATDLTRLLKAVEKAASTPSARR